MDGRQYLPTVAWSFKVRNVILLTSETIEIPATFRCTANPFDSSEPGANTTDKEIGYVVVDNVGNIYSVIATGTHTIDISDDFRSGVGPQTGKWAVISKSAGNGTAPFLTPIHYRRLDKSAIDNIRRIELDVLWKHRLFTYVAYASDNIGTGFSRVDVSLPFQATLESMVEIATPVVGDFVGLWRNGGSGGGEIWTALTGTYVSIYTFTFSGTDKDAALVKKSIFTCTDSAGTTRRYGFIKNAVNSSGTITVTVVATSNLASGDKDFKVAYNLKIYPFIHYVRIPGQVTADASYPVGTWNLDLLEDMKFISSDASAITPAAGSGASMTWNVYSGATALYGTAPDLGTSSALRDQRPTTIDISESANLSLRIPSCGGATNYAADVQFRIYLIPTSLFSAF